MVDMSDIQNVWVFNGSRSRFPSSVFSSKALADTWITKNRLSGVLTRYPLDMSAYDWAVSRGLFTPSKEEHHEPDFIGKFTTASQEHYHYEDGIESGLPAGG